MPSPSDCPVCAAPSTEFCIKHAHGRDWPIRRCHSCGHGFVFPRPALADVIAANAGEATAGEMVLPDPASTLRRRDVHDFTRATDRLARLRGRALDVGAGDGSYSIGLRSIGFTPHMIDLDPRGADVCPRIPGSTFSTDTFEALSDRGPYELILMSQVLEHALDPLDWLRRSHELLRPGGLLVIALPNFGGIYRLLGTRDPYLIPPVHVNFFSPDSMRRALVDVGLVPARIDSHSLMTARRGDGRIGAKRALLSISMKFIAFAIDPFAKGIILRAFAYRPA
jgi:SAM-dependent methyltransferase